MRTLSIAGWGVVLSVVVTGCSKSDDELMKSAEQSAAHQQWSNATSAYHEVIATHPDGARAAEAHYKIGMILYGQLKDGPGGAATFEAVAGKFPQSPEAPKSLMILGFMFSEEQSMKNDDSSKKYYSMLIANYPNSELARGARLQLEQAPGASSAPTQHFWKDSVKRSPTAQELAH